MKKEDEKRELALIRKAKKRRCEGIFSTICTDLYGII